MIIISIKDNILLIKFRFVKTKYLQFHLDPNF